MCISVLISWRKGSGLKVGAIVIINVDSPVWRWWIERAHFFLLLTQKKGGGLRFTPDAAQLSLFLLPALDPSRELATICQRRLEFTDELELEMLNKMGEDRSSWLVHASSRNRPRKARPNGCWPRRVGICVASPFRHSFKKKIFTNRCSCCSAPLLRWINSHRSVMQPYLRYYNNYYLLPPS